MILRNINREQFIDAITPQDKFANTFKAKCDMMDIWHRCTGLLCDEVLMGAIVVTHSKRKPVIANLQLLHTFFIHRHKGVAKILCEQALLEAVNADCEYFRVSSEISAVSFYRKIGFKFWGEQKSGCLLSMFRIAGSTFNDGIYDPDDAIIQRACHSGKKGCLVKSYGLPH